MACMNAIRKARHDADLGLVVPEHLSIRLTRREGDAELSVNRADTHLEQVRTRLTLSIEDAVGAIDGAAGKGPLGIWKDDPKAAAQRALDLLSDVRDIATESFAGLSESFNSIRKAHQLHADAAMEVVDDAQAQCVPGRNPHLPPTIPPPLLRARLPRPHLPRAVGESIHLLEVNILGVTRVKRVVQGLLTRWDIPGGKKGQGSVKSC
mmetsp:Transcript_10905/g.34683  ORF Transcript_10905/g.34683 Transcript_10905/m.34683 type:complete len:208 (+) Transcript_10905:290-913(+)